MGRLSLEGVAEGDAPGLGPSWILSSRPTVDTGALKISTGIAAKVAERRPNNSATIALKHTHPSPHPRVSPPPPTHTHPRTPAPHTPLRVTRVPKQRLRPAPPWQREEPIRGLLRRMPPSGAPLLPGNCGSGNLLPPRGPFAAAVGGRTTTPGRRGRRRRRRRRSACGAGDALGGVRHVGAALGLRRVRSPESPVAGGLPRPHGRGR